MATGGEARASYVGIGPNNTSKNYSKAWQLQEVSFLTPADEIVELLDRAEALAETYAAVTKGELVSASLAVNVPATPITPESGAYANRAAVVSVTIDGVPGKRATLAIQAARDTIFTGNSEESVIVDIADAALVAYFGNVADFALISDGEEADTMLSGYRIDRAFSGKD